MNLLETRSQLFNFNCYNNYCITITLGIQVSTTALLEGFDGTYNSRLDIADYYVEAKNRKVFTNKITRESNQMKKTNLIIFFIILISLITMITIDFLYYVGVINLHVTISLFSISVIIFIYDKSKRKNIKLIIFGILFMASFLFSIPNYSYSSAVEKVTSQHPGETIQSVEKNTAVYVDGFNFIKPTRHYIVTLKKDEFTQKYRVNPTTGKIFLHQ